MLGSYVGMLVVGLPLGTVVGMQDGSAVGVQEGD